MEPTKEIVTRIEIARRAGVSPKSITLACSEGKALHPATVGKKVDASHPAAIAYIASHTGQYGAALKQGGGPRGMTTEDTRHKRRGGPAPHELPEHIAQYADLTLRQIIDKFGTDYAFLDYLRALKEIEVVNEKRIKNAKAEGELVSRELVKRGIIDPIDSALTNLLTDGAKTIAKRATAMHDAGKDIAEVEAFIKDTISSHVRPMKAKVTRAYDNV